ncbi:hypothetical protein BDZ97DRAFT_1820965 [Flammula alnicola]|nr:hypothetical protein BDZ97DRAFT_1820965 [Flammula alnicola]
MGPPTRPRLVPFTSSTRVPVPVPQVIGAPSAHHGAGFVGNRITSQSAKVCKVDSTDMNVIVEEGTMKASATSDELSIGMHYVRSLGADQLTVHRGSGTATGSGSGSSPATSNVRSSFTSLESSHLGNKSGGNADSGMKVLVRTGERFKFRVPIPSASTPGQTRGYYVKLISGQPLPKFIHPNLNGISTKGVLELSGVATFRDIGERSIGVFAERDGACVARVMIEVVGKR